MTELEVLEALKECDFYELTDENFCDNIITNIPKEYHVDYDNGVTKIAIFFQDADFVVKIPFAGYDVYDEDDEEGESIFSSFQFADDEETGDDYCKAEVVRYNHAVQFGGISQLFAKTSFIGYVNDYPIYIQPICESYASRYYGTKRQTSKSIDIVNKTCKENHFRCFNDVWLADVIDTYGQDTFNKLCEFIKKEDIRDLHSENIGYYHNKPILFDYSGFND